jgi:DNA-binding NarL/FixJ family response regulator
MGLVLDPVFLDDYNATVNTVRAALGEARFASTWAVGRTLDPGRALTEAKAAMDLLAGATTNASEVTAVAAYGLTPREREVLRLLVNGYSDKEIAATLFVSRITASKHVSAIIGKLGAESRTGATSIAFRDGLI